MGFSWLNLEKSQTSYIWPGPAGPGLKSGPGRARPNTQVPGRAGPTRLTLVQAVVIVEMQWFIIPSTGQ